MSFTFMQVGILAFIILVFAFIVVCGAFVATNVFRTFRRVGQIQDRVLQSAGNGPTEDDAKRFQSPGGDVLRCKQCGAVIDSTSELSPEGAIRCNYCNSWTSLYSPGAGNPS